MFILDENDIDLLVSQFVIPSKKYLGGAAPFAFTEQGVAMISSVLRSKRAVEVSLMIMRAFVAMRRFLIDNASVFQRLDKIELKQLDNDRKFDNILKTLDSNKEIPTQGIFFDGQIFDAYKLVSDIVRSAKHSIVLIDNYIDESSLTMLSKKDKNIKVTLLTKTISK